MEEKKPFKERFKNFRHRLKIFSWYLITEPFRQLFQVFIALWNVVKAIGNLTAWMHVTLAFGIIFFIIGNRPWAGFFLSILVVTVLLYEWQSGFFMNRYRMSVKSKIDKKLKENEKKEVEKKW